MHKLHVCELIPNVALYVVRNTMYSIAVVSSVLEMPTVSKLTMDNKSYDFYAQRVPPGKLELMLDKENHGVDLHLGKIADEFDEQYMQNKLCPTLGLKNKDVKDIMKINHDNPGAIR